MTETTVVCLCFSYSDLKRLKKVVSGYISLNFLFQHSSILLLDLRKNENIVIGKLLCDILWWNRHTNKGLNLTDALSYSEIHFFAISPVATMKRNTK